MQLSMLSLIGSGAFGCVIGWIAYRTLRRAEGGSRIADLVTVVAALGGGTVINAQFAEPDLFASYGLGLATGFFAYFVIGAWLDRRARKRAEGNRPAQVAPAQVTGGEGAAPSGGTVPAGTPTEEVGAQNWQGAGPSFQRSVPRNRREFEQ
ncbi:hypothetical protein PV726_16820 [Streptomyces europaeiscabiei]|uniref:hypothetical protein n=1 Tax=Streptomyces europaeiscabiei TaxID=146819 RepID=UPI0029B0FCE5|nr:hypothetical protein [Streptomyces europaeiscabiei]MDX3691974.1 hypothetical protein [Streptomyces europaeiscabiei]